MKNILIIIGIVLLLLVIGGLVFLKALGDRPAAPADYQSQTPTGGPIEAKYLVDGPYEVSVQRDDTLLDFGEFAVYYPTELETQTGRYPVIVLCNGTGTPLSKYPAVARHYASWGFIVIGTEEENSWNAFGAEMCLRYLERMDKNKTIATQGDRESLFYHKVDWERVGVVGHSQGGVGVINAVTDTRHKDVYKTAVSLSPTNKELAHNLFWDYDASLIEVPILLLSGEGGGDDWVVTGQQLQAIYDDVPGQKMMARRVATDHGEMLYMADGYVTAWFRWQLLDDAEAAGAFNGDSPELFGNPLYTDQQAEL